MRIFFSITCLLLMAILFSCRTPRYVYSPAPANIPYFLQKGDSKLSATISNQNGRQDNEPLKNKGYDLQGAYAITNHFAITGSYFFRKEKDFYSLRDVDYFDTSNVYYDRRLFDFGGGYFIALDPKKNISFNIYTGLGFGKFNINDVGIDKNHQPYSRFHSSRITKGYLQSGFNFFPGKPVSVSLAGRFSFVHYSAVSTSYTNDELKYFYLDRINNKTLVYFEPSFNIQAGLRQLSWVKLEASITEAFPSGDNLPSSRIFCGSIGLCFDFSKLRK